MKKFNELYTCPVCGKEVESLLSSGLVKEPCCKMCYDVASRQAIDKACNPAGDTEKRGVTAKTVEAAVREVVKW